MVCLPCDSARIAATWWVYSVVILQAELRAVLIGSDSGGSSIPNTVVTHSDPWKKLAICITCLPVLGLKCSSFDDLFVVPFLFPYFTNDIIDGRAISWAGNCLIFGWMGCPLRRIDRDMSSASSFQKFHRIVRCCSCQNEPVLSSAPSIWSVTSAILVDCLLKSLISLLDQFLECCRG